MLFPTTAPPSEDPHLLQKMKGQPAYCNFLGIFLLFATVTGLESGDKCTTPKGNMGTCLLVTECHPIVEGLMDTSKKRVILDYMKYSVCGFQKKKSLVCCPSTTEPTSSSTTETAPSSTTQTTHSSTTEPTPTTPPMLDIEITIDVSHHRNLYLLPFNLCGPIGEDRIINGKVTDLNEMPWMALVAFSDPQGWEFRCGGTVINSRYVLTAAHCVKFLPSNLKPIFVRLGEHNLNSKIDCQIHEENAEDKVCAPEPQDIRIEEVISHPLYIGKQDLRYDIALLRLSTEVDFTTDSVRPICLPIGLENQEQDLLGKMMTTAGWGMTENDKASNVLLKVKVPVVASKRCTMVYNKKAKISKKSQLCVGGLLTCEDSCGGDSGGPLTFYGYVHGSLRTIQHGIVSFGLKNCGVPGIPAVYTRVGFHMKWILDNMRP